MYTVSIDFGAGAVDCTGYLVGQYPVKRSRSIHNGLKPVIGTCKFALHRNTSLINDFLTATTDPEVTILHDGAAFFKGTIRRTVRVDVGQIRVQGIECQCVDPLYRLDSKLTRTSFTWSNYKISDPTTKTASILHQLFYLAGFSDAELNLSAIDTVVDAYSVDGTGKAVSIRGLIETVLRDAVYSLRVTNSGVVELYDLAPTTYAATMTLLTGSGGNIAEGYSVARDEYKAEAVDVKYWTHKTIADAVVFEDTTGRTASLPCSIPVAAGQYYPEGADASTTIRCVFEYPDYDLVSVASPAVEWSHTGDVTKDVETIDGLGMLIRFSSATGGVITKLKIVGDATVKWTENKIVSEIVASSDERETIESDIIISQTDAERLAAGRAAWHKNATFVYTFNRLTLAAYSSDTLYPASTLTPDTDLYPSGDILLPGDIVQITDTGLLGASQLARVLRVDDGADLKTFTAVCEAVGAYSETPVVQSPVFPRPGSPMATEIGAADDAQARADAAQAAAEAAAIVAIPVYTPANLGTHLDSEPAVHKNGDSYLRYSATSGTANRGVFVSDGTDFARTTDPVYIYRHLADIVYICQLKDTADPPAALYGVEADYGIDSSIQTAHIMAAIIDRLRVGDIVISGTLKSTQMDTVNAQAGETIDAPTPTYWPGADLVTHCAGLADGWHDATGTLDGKTVTHVVKGGADNTVSYQSDDTEETGNGTVKTIVSGVRGKVTVYFDAYKVGDYTPKAELRVNGVLSQNFAVIGPYQTFSHTVNLEIGDTVTIYASTYYSTITVKNFRICPAVNTVGVWNSTDPSAYSFDNAGYYDDAGNVDVDTLDDFITADQDIYWKGSELITALSGKVTSYRTLDLGGGTFNGKTCETIYYSPTLIQLSYVSGADDVIRADSYYTYTGSIVLDDVEGRVLMGDESGDGQYEQWVHNIPGTSDLIITWRNTVSGAIHSITETRAPDRSSGSIEATHSLHAVLNGVDYVRDFSLHNYSATMHGLDVLSNFTNDTLGDWKWYQQRRVVSWEPETAYAVGDLVYNDPDGGGINKIYLCTYVQGTGTSSASGGPTGTGALINDGSYPNDVIWQYVGVETEAGSEMYGSTTARLYSIDGSLHTARGRRIAGYVKGTAVSETNIFNAIAPYIPYEDVEIAVNGIIDGYVVAYAKRSSYYQVSFYCATVSDQITKTVNWYTSTTHVCCLSW